MGVTISFEIPPMPRDINVGESHFELNAQDVYRRFEEAMKAAESCDDGWVEGLRPFFDDLSWLGKLTFPMRHEAELRLSTFILNISDEKLFNVDDQYYQCLSFSNFVSLRERLGVAIDDAFKEVRSPAKVEAVSARQLPFRKIGEALSRIMGRDG